MKRPTNFKSSSLSKAEMKKVVGGGGQLPMCRYCREYQPYPQSNCVPWTCDISIPAPHPPVLTPDPPIKIDPCLLDPTNC